MNGDNTKCMAPVEFVCLLNPFHSAAQSPEMLQPLVFFVIVRGKIVLKRKHGINRIDVIIQRAKNGINDYALPGLISQGFGVRSIQGIGMRKAMIADFLYERIIRFPAGAY